MSSLLPQAVKTVASVAQQRMAANANRLFLIVSILIIDFLIILIFFFVFVVVPHTARRFAGFQLVENKASDKRFPQCLGLRSLLPNGVSTAV